MNLTEHSPVLWLVRSGEGGSEVDACVANGYAAVEYPTVGDVRRRTAAQVLEEVRRATDRVDYDTLAQRLLDFAGRIREGDYVVTSDGARRQLVFGRVNGSYVWREDSPIPGMRHLRPVEWLGRIDWDDLDDDAVTTLVKYPRTILEISEPNLVALGVRAAAGDMLAVAPPTLARRSRISRTPATKAARSDERLCPSCSLWKNQTQFDEKAETCRECAGS